MLQHDLQLGKAGWGQYGHIGNGVQIGRVEDTVMGLAIVSHQTGPVHPQHHMEVVNGRIVEEHVVGPLQKGGIHRKDGDCPLLGHAGSHCGGASLRNAYIKKAVREPLGELLQPRPPGHGGGDGTHPPVRRERRRDSPRQVESLSPLRF